MTADNHLARFRRDADPLLYWLSPAQVLNVRATVAIEDSDIACDTPAHEMKLDNKIMAKLNGLDTSSARPLTSASLESINPQAAPAPAK